MKIMEDRDVEYSGLVIVLEKAVSAIDMKFLGLDHNAFSFLF